MGDLHQIQLVLDRDTVTAAQKQQVEAVAAAATAAAAAEAAGPSGDPGNNGPGFGRGQAHPTDGLVARQWGSAGDAAITHGGVPGVSGETHCRRPK